MNYLENQNGFSELYHYGILGMKWGVRRTPEQLGHKSPEKKKPVATNKSAKEARKKKKAALKKKKAAARLEKRKQDIIKSPTKLYKNRYMFSQSEIDEAMRRFKWEKELRSYSSDEIGKMKERTDQIVGLMDNAVKAYNLVARTSNAFDKDSKLPIIPGNPGDKKKKKE